MPWVSLPVQAKDVDAVGEAGGATGAAAPDAAQLESFWEVVVEEGLFTSSHERKFLGFQLFQVRGHGRVCCACGSAAHLTGRMCGAADSPDRDCVCKEFWLRTVLAWYQLGAPRNW